ncbi:MAG: hypothetical protein NLN65_05480, partial [Candidatus Poseidoniaceae archaeon]|nr:hypothetical protein [Candidatus Poseidoniaceae archaeon]
MNRLVGRGLLKDDVKLLLCKENLLHKVLRHVAMNRDETTTPDEAVQTNKVIAKAIAPLGHNKIHP